MIRKFTKGCSTIPPISTKWTTISNLKLLNTKIPWYIALEIHVLALDKHNTSSSNPFGIFNLISTLTVMYYITHRENRLIKETELVCVSVTYIQAQREHEVLKAGIWSSLSFPHSWLTTGFVTRLTRRMPLVKQELLTLSEHLSSPPVFSGVRVTRSLVLRVYFIYRCLSFCPFSFGLCVVCSSSIYGFWLPLWYLQTLLHDSSLVSTD